MNYNRIVSALHVSKLPGLTEIDLLRQKNLSLEISAVEQPLPHKTFRAKIASKWKVVHRVWGKFK